MGVLVIGMHPSSPMVYALYTYIDTHLSDMPFNQNWREYTTKAKLVASKEN